MSRGKGLNGRGLKGWRGQRPEVLPTLDFSSGITEHIWVGGGEAALLASQGGRQGTLKERPLRMGHSEASPASSPPPWNPQHTLGSSCRQPCYWAPLGRTGPCSLECLRIPGAWNCGYSLDT